MPRKKTNEESTLICVKLYNLLSYIMCNPSDVRVVELNGNTTLDQAIETLHNCYNNEQQQLKKKPRKLFNE